jgi:hypothetical protein
VPAKKGSKAIRISGEVHARLKAHVGRGITQFVERAAMDAMDGRPQNIDKASTDELIKALFGNPERVSEIYEQWKHGSLAYETLGKYVQALVPVQRRVKKT